MAIARAALDGTLALVPTMGALHAGHIALIEAARRSADRIAASIFVNPTQFGANEDFSRYPRHEEEDAQILQRAGCDVLWMPSEADMYPPGFTTSIHVARVSDRWEGEVRPGHFDGVATIVAKLLIAVRPDTAIFGEKDFQQLAVIRRMVTDLRIPAEILAVPTVRDKDGLALSSRNAYLSDDERMRAVALPKALNDARDAILEGIPVEQALEAGRRSLLDAGFSRVDYLALVDSATLEPLEAPAGEMRLIAAAVIGTTRLIDNIALADRG